MISLWQKAGFRENAPVAAVMLLLVHLLYARTVEAGFVTDFTGMQQRLEGATFWGFLDCFGFPALHQVTNFFLYFFHHFFGQNGLPWYLVFTSMHLLNGVLGYHFGKKIFTHFDLPSPRLAALAGSLLFLLCPYQAEVVVWKVCFNFLLSTACVLGSLLFLLRFFDEKKMRLIWWSHGLFMVGLFTFELAVVVPVMAVVLLFFGQKTGAGKIVRWRKMGGYILAQFAILATYFLLNKLLLGGWVGHYGEGTHLKFNLAEVSANLLKYFSKYLTFWRDWPHPLKQEWMAFCENETVAYSAFVLGALTVMAGVLCRRTLFGGDTRRTAFGGTKLQAVWLLWLLFFIALLPVANLYVPWLLHGENDRYGYLASLFFYLGLVALLHFLPKYVRWPLLVAALGISFFYLKKQTTYWHHNATVMNGLLDSFRWEGAPEVYVLAMPENMRGTLMFRDYSGDDSALRHALKYGRGKVVKGKIFTIAQFNLTSSADGVSVTSDSTHHFNVKFDQWGNWWWRNGLGAGDLETEKFRFKTVSRGSEIWVKEPAEGAAFIYSKGSRWEEVF